MSQVIWNCADCGYAHSSNTDNAPYFEHCKGCGTKYVILSNGYQKVNPKGESMKPITMEISRRDYEIIIDGLLSEGWKIKEFIGEFPDGSVALVLKTDSIGGDF